MYREERSQYIGLMASIGYARVSTREQNPDGQTDLLATAGCEKVFVVVFGDKWRCSDRGRWRPQYS